MTTVITAPADTKAGTGAKIFLAGGITGTHEWQQEAIGFLDGMDATLFNPRRAKFPKGPDAARKQIEWEFARLRKADGVMFWFPKETLCPIALFELGAAMERTVKIWVGTHPQYKRRLDVGIQLALRRPKAELHSGLEGLCRAVRGNVEKRADPGFWDGLL